MDSAGALAFEGLSLPFTAAQAGNPAYLQVISFPTDANGATLQLNSSTKIPDGVTVIFTRGGETVTYNFAR